MTDLEILDIVIGRVNILADTFRERLASNVK